MITPIFRSIRLCVTVCGIMHPRCCQPVSLEAEFLRYRPAKSCLHYTTNCNTHASAPEDGRDHRPKHVELMWIINKPLLLDLVGVHIIYTEVEVYTSPEDISSQEHFHCYLITTPHICHHQPVQKTVNVRYILKSSQHQLRSRSTIFSCLKIDVTYQKTSCIPL